MNDRTCTVLIVDDDPQILRRILPSESDVEVFLFAVFGSRGWNWRVARALFPEPKLTHPAKFGPFRVAVSFLGEHRSRAEKIADALASSLGRERVFVRPARRLRSGDGVSATRKCQKCCLRTYS